MAKKIKLGDFNRLRIVKKVDFGLYLDGGDEGEILLPSRYVPENVGIGDELDVFLYLDQEERLIATTETPLAKVGDFAYLEVKWVNEFGAFLGWGLMKDIFCPFREQKKRMVLGNSYIVHIHIDEESYRIVASAKIERYLNEDHPHYKHGDEGEILLPSRYVPEDAGIGDELDVFIYLDQEERLIATTETPLAKVGDFAYLEVKWVNEYGAFLGWGLMKDIFCPFREQKKRMVLGNSYIVHIHIDEESYRIVASAKIERYLNEDHPHYKHGDEVDLLIWQKTDLGFKVIIDNQYPGLLYQDQIFQYIHTGDKMKGYIGRVRPDGKIDVTLQKTGIQQTADFAETLYQYLLDNDGECNLGDKSEADDIYERFHVSKKVYKRAIGDLYKKRLITVSPMSIRLAE